MKPALLIIDMQSAYYNHTSGIRDSFEEVFVYINAAITLFRKKDLPIFVVLHVDEKEGLTLNREGFKICEQIHSLPSDFQIKKHKGSAFTGTKLEEMLNDLAVDTLIITGFSAEYCVLSTYRAASDLGYTPILLRGALASENQENIPFVEGISNLISYGALETLLQ